jgi:hypothetical protein
MSEENKKSYHWDSGKGSRPRSYSVTQEEFGKNWDAIFGKKDKVPEEESGCSTVASESPEAAEG